MEELGSNPTSVSYVTLEVVPGDRGNRVSKSDLHPTVTGILWLHSNRRPLGDLSFRP